MNKLRTSILAIASLMALTGCDFASSSNNNNDKKDNTDTKQDSGDTSAEHNWSSAWSTNATKHWHKCTDEDCEEISDEGDHELGDWIYDSYATSSWMSTTQGERHKVCSVCNYQTEKEKHDVKESDIPHNHTWKSEWENDASKHWHACSGTVTTSSGWGGTQTSQCTERKDEANHSFSDWVIDNYAVVEHDAAGADDKVTTIGNKHRTCSVCQYVERTTHTEEEPLAAHTHAIDDVWQSNEIGHWHQCSFGKKTGYGGRYVYVCPEKSNYAAHTWNEGVETKAPTTSSEGVKTYTCSVCNSTKTESIAPLVDNTDGSEVISVAFNKLEGKQAATVNPKTKAYLDAMKSAEKSIAEPYKFSELKNGVNVEDFLKKDDYKDSAGQGHNKPDGVTLSWNKGTMDYSSAIIRYSTKADMSNALEAATTGNSVKINNLYSNTKYYYQLTYTKNTTLYKSNIETFETADYIRFIDMGLVYNVRDMGGYKTSYGGRVKQGLIYRGSELTPKAYSDNNGSHPKNIDEEILQLQKNVLKIKVEIDHRGASEAQNLTASPITTTEIPVEYKREGYKVNAYDGFLNAENTEIQNIYGAFAEAATKPVYFHCIGGADRTGCAAYVLLGLLGVSYSDTVSDFEVTTETNYPRSRYFNNGSAPYYSRFPEFLTRFQQASWFKSNVSFKENCEAFLKSKGVTDATIEKIRKAMIEGYDTSSGGNQQESGGGNQQESGGGNTNPVTTECAHTFGSATTASGYSYKVCSKCSYKDIYWDVNTASSDSAVKPSSAPHKIASNNQEITYKITLDKAYTGKFYLFGYIDNYSSSTTSNASCGFFSGKNNGATGTSNNGNSANTQVSINGTAISITNKKSFVEMGVQKGENYEASALLEVGSCSLKQGENVIKWKRLDSYGPTVYELHFIGQ